MANSIGWGQGVVNNSAGWGQGAINNTILWGRVQYSTESEETNIFGDLAPLTQIVTDFETRVTTDLGTFEAFDCLFASLL